MADQQDYIEAFSVDRNRKHHVVIVHHTGDYDRDYTIVYFDSEQDALKAIAECKQAYEEAARHNWDDFDSQLGCLDTNDIVGLDYLSLSERHGVLSANQLFSDAIEATS